MLLVRKQSGLLGLVFLLILAASERGYAQVSQRVEDLVESLGSAEQAQALAAELDYLRANPLDLNRASADELAELPWISPAAADSIVRYRRRHGPFRSERDLRAVGILEPGTLRALAPYIRVGRNRCGILLRLRGQEASGEPETRAWRRFATLRTGWTEDLGFGFTLEGDPGETRAGDFVVGYVQLRRGPAWRLVGGGYELALGQGLLFGRPYAPRAGPELGALVRRAQPGLRGYGSTNEAFPLRGAAVRWCGEKFGLLAFGSSLLRDGYVDSLSGRIRWVETGYHRTALERARRSAVRERIAGVDLDWHASGRTWLGLTLARQAASLGPTVERGRAAAFRWRFRWLDVETYGEAAALDRAPPAWVAGLRFSRTRLEALLLCYNYSSGLTSSFRSNPFEGRRRGDAQRGALAGFRLGGGGTGLAVYVDGRARPGDPGPTQEFFVQIWRRIAQHARLTLRLRDRQSEEWCRAVDPAGRARLCSRPAHVTRARLQLDTGGGPLTNQVRACVTWKAGDLVGQKLQPRGRLFYQQLTWRSPWHVRALVRFTVFDVRDADAAVYAYEPGLPGTFGIRSYSGAGWQTLLVLSAWFGAFRLSTRLSRTVKLSEGSAQPAPPAGWKVGLQVDVVWRGDSR